MSRRDATAAVSELERENQAADAAGETEVALRQGTELEGIEWPDCDELEQLSGHGSQHVRLRDDVAIPRLKVLQATSKEVKRGAEQINGAAEGLFFNTVKQTTYDGEGGILLVPCAFLPALLEFRPNRGGFAGRHAIDSPLRARAERGPGGVLVLPSTGNGPGNNLQEVAEQYVLQVTDDERHEIIARALFTFASTALKRSRNWNALIAEQEMTNSKGQKFVPPRYAYVYRMSTVQESNEKGEWWAPKASRVGQTPRHVLTEAIAFTKAIEAGEVKIEEPEDESSFA